MEKNKFTHGSLFSGIGGPEIAAEEMGWKNMFHCEINPFGRKILDYWFPNSKSYEDITKTNFTEWRGKINVLTGGFPCQPFSCAGQRKGAEDDRYLWPEMLRAIREIQPDWVVGENVAGILSMVQPGSETALGREESLFGEVDRKRILHRQEYVVETVCNDLEREGYFVQPVVIPACAVGAPHRRDRVFFIAHRADAGVKGMQRKWEDNILSGRTASDTTCRGSGGTPHESCCENERQNGYETQQPFVRGCVRASSHSDGERCNNRSDNWKERPICYDQKRDSEENQSERTERKRRTCENGSVASYSQCPGSGQVQQEIQSEQSNGHSFDSNGGEWDAPYSSSEGLSTLRFPTSIEKKKWENEDGCSVQPAGNVRRASFAERWKNFPTQSPVCSRDDGISTRLDGIAFSKWRQESIKAYGNAIVDWPCMYDADEREFDMGEILPKYELGEVVAIAQSYMDVDRFHRKGKNAAYLEYLDSILPELKLHPGWTNKMFVKADLMPRHIEFTDRKVERLQDISDEDCLKEGIYEDSGDDEFPPSIFYEFEGNKDNGFDTPREAFAALIDKVSGKGTWESNPYVWAYEFELMK